MNALTHPWVGAMLCVELKTPDADGSLPERFEAIIMPGFSQADPATAGVRGNKASRGTNNSACSAQVLSPRHQGGLKSISGDGNADAEGFSMTVTNHNPIVPLSFEGAEVRLFDHNGEPWFVAADVCAVLDIKNTSQAVSALDDDERSMLNIGRQGKAHVINESGLFALILRCRDAMTAGTVPHRFRKWVTGEVLPSIRKTGAYHQEAPASLTFDQQIEQMRQERLLMEKRRLMLKEVRAVSPLDAHRLAQEWGYVTTAPQQPGLLPGRPSLPALRNGLGMIVLNGQIVTYDACDFEMDGGDQAVVICPNDPKGNDPRVDTIHGRPVNHYWRKRSAALAPVPMCGGQAFPIAYVLGRVLSVEAL